MNVTLHLKSATDVYAHNKGGAHAVIIDFGVSEIEIIVENGTQAAYLAWILKSFADPDSFEPDVTRAEDLITGLVREQDSSAANSP